jgi:hypothetical protein
MTLQEFLKGVIRIRRERRGVRRVASMKITVGHASTAWHGLKFVNKKNKDDSSVHVCFLRMTA